jgi:thioredoxin-like negative regulator of GroEL
MFILLVLSLVGPPAGEQGHRVQGRIEWGSAPAPGEPFLVRLESFGGPTVGEVFTDGAGNFTFTAVPAGVYHVRAGAPGFQDVMQRVDVPSPGRIVIFMDPEIQLPGVASDSPRDGSPIVDIRELAIPKKAVSEYEKALKDMENGDKDRGTERLEQVVAMAPDYFDAHMALARQYRTAGRTGDAEKHWTRAAEIRGHDAEPLVEIGRLYIERKDAASAASILERASGADPKSPAAHYYYALALYQDGQYLESQTTLQRFLDRYAPPGIFRLLLAHVFIKQQRLEDALQQIDTYLEQNPDEANRSTALETRRQLMEILSSETAR